MVVDMFLIVNCFIFYYIYFCDLIMSSSEQQETKKRSAPFDAAAVERKKLAGAYAKRKYKAKKQGIEFNEPHPFESKKKEILGLAYVGPIQTHPVYGEFASGIRLKLLEDGEPLLVHSDGLIMNGYTAAKYEIEKHKRQIHVGKKHISAHRIILETFFPQEQYAPKVAGSSRSESITVDHIDENAPQNHAVINLQWLEHSKNIKKARENQSRECTRKDDGKAKSRSVDCYDSTLGDGANPTQYASVNEAARQLGLNPGSVHASISRGVKCSGKYTFRYSLDSNKDLDGEIWKRTEVADSFSDSYLQVSNKGRILTKKGVKTVGSIHNSSKKQRMVGVTFCGVSKIYSVHQVVWSVWNNKPLLLAGNKERANGTDAKIVHRKDCPLDSDGCFLNFPEYLIKE